MTLENVKPLKHLLLVDNDPAHLMRWGDRLRNLGYGVATAEDGKMALSLLESREFDALVTELMIRYTSGLELLRWTREKKPAMRIVVMTAFEPIIETKTAVDLGCDEFIAKPFADDALMSAIERALAGPPSQHSDDPGHYARIPISGFSFGAGFVHPVYIRLGAGRFLKVVQSSEDLDSARTAVFKARGVQDFWIRREHFPEYVALMESQVSTQPVSAQIPEQAWLVMSQACEIAAENLRVMGISEKSIEFAMAAMRQTASFLEHQPRGLELVAILSSATAHKHSHAVLCGFLASLVGKAMDLGKEDCLLLSLGGFLHDIGVLNLDQNYLNRDTSSLSEQERAEYEKHPLLGQEAIKNFKMKGLSLQVEQMILQHHESPTGKGYPSQLKHKDINPFALVIGAVDGFCERLVKLEPRHRQMALQVLDFMTEENRGFYDDRSVRALRGLLL